MEVPALKILQPETYFEFSLTVRCSFEKNVCVLLILARRCGIENNSQTFCFTMKTNFYGVLFQGENLTFWLIKTIFLSKIVYLNGISL